MYCALLPVWMLGAAGLRQLLEATMESFGGNVDGRLKLSSGSDYGLQHFCSFCRREGIAGVHGGEELKEPRCSNTLSCRVESSQWYYTRSGKKWRYSRATVPSLRSVFVLGGPIRGVQGESRRICEVGKVSGYRDCQSVGAELEGFSFVQEGQHTIQRAELLPRPTGRSCILSTIREICGKLLLSGVSSPL